jgi:hypothetical protein
MKLPTIGIEKCPCSENCKTYSLTGVGRFYQGSGFDKDVAGEVAMRLNAHDDLVAALKAMVDLDWAVEGLYSDAFEKKAQLARAALAKAGEK